VSERRREGSVLSSISAPSEPTASHVCGPGPGKDLRVEEMREPGPSLPTSGVTHVRVIAEYEDPQYQRPPICNAAGRLVFARASDKQRGGSTRYRKGLLICNASRPCVIACPGRKTASGPMRYHVAASQNRFGFMRYRLATSQNRMRVYVLPPGPVSIPHQGPCVTASPGINTASGSYVTACTGRKTASGFIRYRHRLVVPRPCLIPLVPRP